MDGSCTESGPAEDRAQAGGGPEQEGRGRIRADDVYPVLVEHSLIGRRRRTLGMRADIACVLYICTWAVMTIPKWY